MDHFGLHYLLGDKTLILTYVKALLLTYGNTFFLEEH
jgi:hypothetical protein